MPRCWWLLHLTSYYVYHCDIIHDRNPSYESFWVIIAVNQSVAQSISVFWVLNHGTPCTELYTCIRTVPTSSSHSEANWSIHRAVITGLAISLTCVTTWLESPSDVNWIACWGSMSVLRSFGGMQLHVAPHSINACVHCSFLSGSYIQFSWKICEELCTKDPHQYGPDLRDFRLSMTTLGDKEF